MPSSDCIYCGAYFTSTITLLNTTGSVVQHVCERCTTPTHELDDEVRYASSNF